MDMNCLAVILAMAPTPSTPGAPAQPPWMQFLPMVLIVVVFYFILIRPQQKKAKQQAALLKGLKSGDKVGTASGIIGVVVTVKDNTVTLRSGDSKLEVSKISVTEIISSDSTTAS
jgi:preprotein translocase subunit YajC